MIIQPKEAVEERENEEDKDETKEDEDIGDSDEDEEEEAEHRERARAPSEPSPTPTGSARAVERRSWAKHRGEQEREMAEKLGNMTKVQQQREKRKKVLEPLEGIEDSTMLKGVMLDKDVTHSERQKRILQPTQVTPMLPGWEEGDLRKILEQELAEQRTQLEEMEDELQQTKDQKIRLEVNMQTRKTHFERDLAAKEKVREERRRGIAKQLRDLETELDEEREQKQAEQRTQLEEMEDELQQTEDQNTQTRNTQFEGTLRPRRRCARRRGTGWPSSLGTSRPSWMRSASRSRPSSECSWRRWRTSCRRPRTRRCGWR